MKHLLSAIVALFTVTVAHAQSLNDFRNSGQINAPFNLDFAMQSELNSSVNNINSNMNGLNSDISELRDDMNQANYIMDKKVDAGIAGVAALAMIPQGDGVLGMGISKHSSGKAISAGYSKTLAAKYLTRIGLSFNSEKDLTVGAGLGFQF